MSRVVVDTGPLVAFLNADDEWHDWALEALGAVAPPLATCEAVLSEAAFLLGRGRRADRSRGADALLALAERGLLDVGFRLDREVAGVRRLVARYASVPMSLADACLVRMTELAPGATVLTLDHDFRVYRRNGRGVIPVIAPWR